MSDQNLALQVSDLNTSIVQLAIDNANFRAALLANPKAAVEKATGAPLPGNLNLKVVEATAGEFTVVLPYQPKAGANGELSDSDLEAVAGGSAKQPGHGPHILPAPPYHRGSHVGTALGGGGAVSESIVAPKPGTHVPCNVVF